MNLDAITKSLASVQKSVPGVATMAAMTVAPLVGPDEIRKSASSWLPEPTQEEAWELVKALAAPRMAQGRSEAQAVTEVFDQWPALYAWQQSLAKGDATEAPPARPRPGEQYADQVIAAEIEKRVRQLVKSLASTLPSHEYEVRYVAAYDGFITKSPEGRALYSLHDRVYGRTIAELDQDAPAVSAQVRKFLK